MNSETPSPVVTTEPRFHLKFLRPANLVLAFGGLCLTLPTMFDVARDSWSTDQGGHGPLVLATGSWALWRELKDKKIEATNADGSVAVALLALTVSLFVVARITGVIEIEAFMMYGALIAGGFSLYGRALIRAVWFPLIYLAFTLPPPQTLVAAVTQPAKVAISSSAVSMLSLLGYPIAGSGVTIQIGQYELLVAAACAGLNSIITLSALCMFYVYLRHRSNLVAFIIIAVVAIPVAIISNFIRVVLLVLITYYFGNAAAQGFLHEFAGLVMFAVALLLVFSVDQLATHLILSHKRGVVRS